GRRRRPRARASQRLAPTQVAPHQRSPLFSHLGSPGRNARSPGRAVAEASNGFAVTALALPTRRSRTPAPPEASLPLRVAVLAATAIGHWEDQRRSGAQMVGGLPALGRLWRLWGGLAAAAIVCAAIAFFFLPRSIGVQLVSPGLITLPSVGARGTTLQPVFPL